MVEKAAGRRHHDVHPGFQGILLAAIADPAMEQDGLEGKVLSIELKLLDHLLGQLPGGLKDEHAGDFLVVAQAGENRQAEGGRLAGPRLGAADQVLPLQQLRDRFRLDRGWPAVAFLLQGRKDAGVETKFFKRLGRHHFAGPGFIIMLHRFVGWLYVPTEAGPTLTTNLQGFPSFTSGSPKGHSCPFVVND